MNKITARAIACFKGRDTSNKTPRTLNFNEIHVVDISIRIKYSHLRKINILFKQIANRET